MPDVLRRGPFRGTRAVASGLVSRAQLRSSGWRRLFRDVYVCADRPVDHRLRTVAAALLLPPGAAICGRSAADLFGAGLADTLDDVTVATPTSWRGMPGMQVCRRPLRAGDTRLFAGIPVTTPLATAYELARSLPLEEAVVWLDALGHARNLTRAQMRAQCQAHRGEPGWLLATRAVDLCDPRAESPPESRVRLWLAQAGVPAPIPQYQVLHEGEFVARVDLAWPQVAVALEYDGQWHADPGQLGRDRRRIRTLTALGWYVYPVTSADLHHPDALVANIRAVLAARGLPRK
jgi:hypothetical protein